MANILIESHYFPCVEYISKSLSVNNFIIESQENFIKQSLRNRCYILSSQKIDKLIVPIKKTNNNTKICNIIVNNDSKWYNHHLKSIYTCYGKAPYFIHYIEKINKILKSHTKYLIDLNFKILEYIFEILRIDVNILFTTQYQQVSYFKDLRNKILKNKIGHNFKNYTQLFGENFQPNLSILDLIMCEGPNAINFL